jgi:outer membrane protein assembly factor BamA
VLNSKNALIPGQYYSASKAQVTQRNISNLEMFKFTSVNFVKSDSVGKLNAIVNASSLPKYQLSQEYGINVSQGQGYPGPIANLTFTNRNIFGGCEIFAINLRGSIEGQPSLTTLNNSISTSLTNVFPTYEYGGNISITSPKLLIPSKFKYKFNNNNPKTKYIFSYQNTIRNEYTRGIIKGSINYFLQRGENHRFTVIPLDLSIVNTTRIQELFQQRLDELYEQKKNSLKNSFSQSFISNFTFTYQYNSPNTTNTKKTTSFFKTSAEIGGLTLHLLNNITGVNNNIILKDGKFLDLVFYKFLRLSADYRKYITIGKNKTLAYRINGGYITPYGGGQDIPYEKYFFAGGSNSVRAWQPRRLGPGTSSEINAVTGKYSYETERQGTILIEGSVETRFKIIKFLEGALFIDAGNIWNNLPTSPANTSLYKSNISTIYNEIAVGAGYGLRFNFTYFIVRFDFGYKIWDPARPVGEKFRGNKITLKTPFGEEDQMVFQLGIGYPF